MKKFAFTIFILGLLFITLSAFSFYPKVNLNHIGTVQVCKTKTHNLKWIPLIGIAGMLSGGAGLLIFRGKC